MGLYTSDFRSVALGLPALESSGVFISRFLRRILSWSAVICIVNKLCR